MALPVTVKLLAASAAWLKSEAVRFARSLIGAAYMTRSRIVDGYIIKAQRVGDRAIAHIVDTPAYLATPGRALVAGPGSAHLPGHCAVIAMSGGRDDVVSGRTDTVASLFPAHTGCVPLPVVLVGNIAAAGASIEAGPQTAITPFTGVGVFELTYPLLTPTPYPVNPYAFAGRADSNQLYLMTPYAPSVAMARYSAGAGGWEKGAVDAPDGSPWGLALSDSILWDTALALPFCKRSSPPPYDPSSTAATQFNGAQRPWARSLFIGRGTLPSGRAYYDTFVAIHAVTDMRNDEDREGAKGIWFGVFRAIDSPREVELQWFYLDDMRDSSEPVMRPHLNVANDAYGTNLLYPAMLTRLDSGLIIAVVLHANFTDAVSGGLPYSACYAYRWSGSDPLKEQFAGPVESINSPTEGKRHDFAFPLGVDTDGKDAYAVFFSSDGDYVAGVRTTQASIDIVRITETSSSVVLSTLIDQRYCHNITNSLFACVRYIGNGKYIFPATDQFNVVDGQLNVSGDLVVMIYDSANNSVSVAGTVIATKQLRTKLFIGAIDCPAPELAAEGVVMRPATLLLTFGGLGQSASEPGIEAGSTYISSDSGSTWRELAGFGSPGGVYYCGTAIQPRSRNL
ncbi:hypothetical protein [Pseudomonas leptonychotis]|uniref:hypothetical protein n=1 Tax=Pseudomonas leptonychotis TaxID=2448482 RepID=UPI0038663FF3